MWAVYGTLVAFLMWFKNFRSDTEEIGFEFNPYYSFVAYIMVNKNQKTIRFNVDDLFSSHIHSKVNV